MIPNPVAALRECAFWLERGQADEHRARAYRAAADEAAALRHEDWPSSLGGWRALPRFGTSTSAVAFAASAGRVADSLARLRDEGSVSLDPAGDALRETLRGDLHVHTTWSDGVAPLDEMTAVAEALGHDYVAVTDHSARLAVAHGLGRDRVVAQIREIDRVQQGRQIRILRGTEVDILVDGSLDHGEDLLHLLDVVVASVHVDLGADPDAMTARMVRAVANPHTTILGHCTGRKRRPDGAWRDQSRFDADVVFAACAMFGVAVEINARPDRSDPPIELLELAVDAGCLFSIDSDAHAPGHLDFLTYGAARAAEAGIPPERIITTWPVDRLLDHARRHR